MLTLQLSGFEPDPKLLEEIYQSADKVYNALPLDSDLCVTLAQEPDHDFFKCIVNFHSLWGHSEAREAWVRPSEALNAALMSIAEDIKTLRSSIHHYDMPRRIAS